MCLVMGSRSLSNVFYPCHRVAVPHGPRGRYSICQCVSVLQAEMRKRSNKCELHKKWTHLSTHERFNYVRSWLIAHPVHIEACDEA